MTIALTRRMNTQIKMKIVLFSFFQMAKTRYKYLVGQQKMKKKRENLM